MFLSAVSISSPRRSASYTFDFLFLSFRQEQEIKCRRMSDGKNILHLRQRIITIKFNYNLSFYVLHFYEPHSLGRGLALCVRPAGRRALALFVQRISIISHFISVSPIFPAIGR